MIPKNLGRLQQNILKKLEHKDLSRSVLAKNYGGHNSNFNSSVKTLIELGLVKKYIKSIKKHKFKGKPVKYIYYRRVKENE